MITIGNAQGFWGDSTDAPAALVGQYPQLDYLTLDYLAEVSMSILAAQRAKDPALGYARDFVDVVRSLVPLWQAGSKTKVVCNAGGLNPEACAAAVQAVLTEAGISKKVGLVAGDDVLAYLKAHPEEENLANWESQEPLTNVIDRLNTANAYIGADGVVEVLGQGADIVVTGRVADPSLTLGICMHEFGWRPDDYNKLAAGTVAGHILECGTQACGGISTEWLDMPEPSNIGFPIIEVSEDGSIIVTKPAGTGGRVTERTVKEQLLYEIGDPRNYLSPDCRVDFTSLQVREIASDRVSVSNASGSEPTEFYKVSATYKDGWRASSTLTIFGRDAIKKAQRAGQAIFDRLARSGTSFERSNIECLGANACAAGALPASELLETVLRVSVLDHDRAKIEKFAREIVPLVTSGPQGTTGYAGGRPTPSPVFSYWPCLIRKTNVGVVAKILD